MEELFILINAERRCLLVMEGTTGAIVSTRFFKWDTTVDELYQIGTSQNLIKEWLWDPSFHLTVVLPGSGKLSFD